MSFKTKKYRVVRKGRFRGILPKEGEITIHTRKNGEPSGAIILRCPSCGGMQHKQATIEGPDDAPTILKVMECDCIKCRSMTFQIRAGVAHEVPPEGTCGPELGEDAINAGAFYPSEVNKK